MIFKFFIIMIFNFFIIMYYKFSIFYNRTMTLHYKLRRNALETENVKLKKEVDECSR